jgi:hypothetical protein
VSTRPDRETTPTRSPCLEGGPYPSRRTVSAAKTEQDVAVGR